MYLSLGFLLLLQQIQNMILIFEQTFSISCMQIVEGVLSGGRAGLPSRGVSENPQMGP